MKTRILLGLWVSWSVAAGAAEYVVDQRHAAAADDNPGTVERPLKTISKAVALVKPGDTVTVRAGVYREEVEIPTSGAAGQLITLRAAPGERAVVTGTDPIAGWRPCTEAEARGNPNWRKIRVAEVDWRPTALFQDDRMLKISRFPSVPKSKYMSEGGDKTRVVDSVNLTQPAGFWEGGLLVVRDAKTTNYDQGTIVGYDPAKHELVADQERRVPVVGGKDEYFVKNLVSIIGAPGDWAYDGTTTPARVFFWPVDDADPNACRIEGTRRGYGRLVRWAEGAGFLVIEGLEITGAGGNGLGQGGTEQKIGHDIELRRCIVRHNNRTGIDLSRHARVTVRNCIVARNGHHGITFGFSKDCTVEGNLVHGNAVDGIVFGWYSSGNRVLRNCVFDQWSQSHPDGIQTFRGVSDFTIEDNVFLNIGQGFQCENTYRTRIINNVFAGTRGGCLQLSPRTAERDGERFGPCSEFVIRNNTLIFNAGHNVTLLATFQAANNIMGSGYRDAKGGFTSDHNLFIDGRVQAVAEQEAHSKAGRPKFRNAPAARYSVDDRNFAKCTPGRLYLKNTAGAAVGDLIEVNFDGVARTVTEVGAGYLAFEPPLRFVHPFGWDAVLNWKDNRNFTLDLRLAEDDTMARGQGENGANIGANLDVQAYLRGDFNGDGTRDVPEALPALEYEVHTSDE